MKAKKLIDLIKQKVNQQGDFDIDTYDDIIDIITAEQRELAVELSGFVTSTFYDMLLDSNNSLRTVDASLEILVSPKGMVIKMFNGRPHYLEGIYHSLRNNMGRFEDTCEIAVDEDSIKIAYNADYII